MSRQRRIESTETLEFFIAFARKKKAMRYKISVLGDRIRILEAHTSLAWRFLSFRGNVLRCGEEVTDMMTLLNSQHIGRGDADGDDEHVI